VDVINLRQKKPIQKEGRKTQSKKKIPSQGDGSLRAEVSKGGALDKGRSRSIRHARREL